MNSLGTSLQSNMLTLVERGRERVKREFEKPFSRRQSSICSLQPLLLCPNFLLQSTNMLITATYFVLFDVKFSKGR